MFTRSSSAIVLLTVLWSGLISFELTQFFNVSASAEETASELDAAEQLLETGDTYQRQENYPQALAAFQQALQLYRSRGDRAGEAKSLYSIGTMYLQQGSYARSLTTFQDALQIFRETNDTDGIWRTLTNIGSTYGETGQYRDALAVHQEALQVVQPLQEPLLTQAVLNNLGLIHSYLGEYQQALTVYQQALEQLAQVQPETEADRTYQQRSRGYTLHNTGLAYERLGQYAEAIDFYNQALVVKREVGLRGSEASTLNSLGYTYYELGELEQALPLLQEAEAIQRNIGEQAELAYTIDSLGAIYAALGQQDAAWSAYQESLALLQQVGDRPQQRIVFSHIGDLLAAQNQPQLAIVFYKQSVNVTEAIRQDLAGLPTAQQQSYTNSIADTYRTLADLLLQQNRVLEAQQVLDLLKVQELEEYLQQVRGTEETAEGLPLLPEESRVVESFNVNLDQAIALGRELFELEAIATADRTPEQQQRLAELRQMQQQALVAFNEFLNDPDVQTVIAELRQTTAVQNIEPAYLNSWREKLQQLPNAVLLYPLILDDRLELVVSTPYSPPIHRSVPVSQVELNEAIVAFRSALDDPNSDPLPAAQQLYDWLIRPIEAELTQAGAETILYAPDRQLRYIPLAALHDGQQWLAERLRVNNITALSLNELTAEPQDSPTVLAGAFTNGRYNFQVAGRRYGYSGLPFAETEVQMLAALYPETTELFDRAFNRAATEPYLNDYNIVHFATHAAFVTGQPEESFILLGDGERITLRDIDSWNLPNVDLIVLSACQTGLGTLADGREILGFGYQIQKTQAEAALASLWLVDDGGTQALMEQFYEQLRQPNTTKAAALQQAQIALIHNRDDRPQDLALSHPHYWAPFILIGNGL